MPDTPELIAAINMLREIYAREYGRGWKEAVESVKRVLEQKPKLDVTTLGLRKLTLEEAEARIAEIDKMFDEATCWGSWMIECANEREALAGQHGLPHKHQARTHNGERTD